MALTSIATENTKKSTFVNAVDRAENEMQQLLARIEALSSRLCGSVPSADQGAGELPPDGIFHTVYSTANRISARISSANEELERIERALP